MAPQSPDTSNAALPSGAPAPTHAADEVPLAQRLLVRPEEAATLLGLSRSTVYELLHAGELPALHVGRTTRIPVRAILRWIERQTGE